MEPIVVMRITGRLVTVLVVLSLAIAVWSLWISRPLFDEQLDPATLGDISIVAPEVALTFARYPEGQVRRVLLVTKYENGQLSGISTYRYFRLAEDDPVVLFGMLGYEALAKAAASSAPQQTVPVESLLLPFDAHPENIGIGTNYVEHAREAQVREEPFVFPKLVQPTPFTANIQRGDARLLDYEAELGFVALDDLSFGESPQGMGLVLANDFTDRWSLLRNLSLRSEMGTTGFVDGKSREGFAPIGNLLVIPRDLESFYRQVELRLYVNGRMRQRETAGSMVWPPQQMLAESFRRAQWTFHHSGGTAPLLPRPGLIPRGTIIFSGTPAGVIFKPANIWNAWAYLRRGDEVIVQSQQLGLLRNRVVD